MKISVLLLALLVATLQTFGQRKSKNELKDAQIDSLNVKNKSLTVQLDSVSGELTKFTGMYNAIKDKVFKYQFDPAKTSFLIDSLRSSRDSASVLLTGTLSLGKDSLIMLIKENKTLIAKIDSIKMAWEKEKVYIPEDEIESAKAITGLKKLKELFDDKIITDAEFLILKKKYVDKL